MLITLEGLDGSGKSTLWRGLKEKWGDKDDVVFTREPTDSWYGEAVDKSIHDDDASPLAELFLYMADHANHVENTIRPANKDGKIVISDRYSGSRYAYQSATLEEQLQDPMGFIKRLHEPWSVTPDLTLYLDIPPEKAVKRSERGNKFEQKKFLETVEGYYIKRFRDPDVRVSYINADLPKQQVLRQAVAEIRPEDDQWRV